MKKFFFCFFLVLVVFCSFAVTTFATSTSDTPPSVPSDIVQTNYICFKSPNSGNWYFVSTSGTLSVIRYFDGKGWLSSSTTESLNNYIIYKYDTSTSKWVVLQNGGSFCLFDDGIPSSSFVLKYSNKQVDILNSSDFTVYQSGFFQFAPCRISPIPIPKVVAGAVPSIYSALSGNLGIVLPVGLVILAILLGVSLIPRVISLFR